MSDKMWAVIIFSVIGLTMADSSVEKQLVTANNQFSAKLFNEVVKDDPGKSVVVSGYSAVTPLLLLGLGAVGDSQDELLKAVGLPNEQVAKEGYVAVNKDLNSLEEVELKVVNRVYLPVGESLNETFREMSKAVFGSDVKSVDFSKNVEVANDVNAFVEENTNHRIKNLASPRDYDENTKVSVVNAVYFKGLWKSYFMESATAPADFHVGKTKTVKVPMMTQTGLFKYAHSVDLQAKLLELPFKGEKSSVLFVLPDEVDGLVALQEKLVDPSKLDKAVQSMKAGGTVVALPKFRVESDLQLVPFLKKIGINKLFVGLQSKLYNVYKSQVDIEVSSVKQKTYLDVSERGVEAAAATKVDGVGSLMPVNWFEADRPFYLELRAGDVTLFSAVYYGN